MSPEEQARACQDLRLEARSEFLMLIEHPEDVVPLLPEAELVQTVRAGGMSEAAWLLELATPEQRVAAFDLDCWNGSELQVSRVHEWLDALIEAGSADAGEGARRDRARGPARWRMHAETEVAVVSKEQVPPIGYFTPDGVVYFGTAPDASPHRVHEISHALFAEVAAAVLADGLRACSSRARPSARSTRCAGARTACRTSASPTSSRPCASTGRCRSSASRTGFRRAPRPRSSRASSLPRQLRGTLLGEALAKLAPARAADLLGYVLGVANSLAIADNLPLSESESVPRALEKAVRGIDTGIRELARARGQAPEEVLDRTSPLDLFRVGATVDPSLKERVK